MNKTTLTGLALWAALALSGHAQNLLLNGSFESPVLPPNNGSITTPDLWQPATSAPSLLNGVFAPGYPAPQDGQQYIALGVEGDGTPDGVSQAFTITNAGAYVLSWFDSTPLGFGMTSPYSVSVFNSAAQTVAVRNLDAYRGTLEWVSHSIQLSLSSGAYTLQFRAEPPIGHVGAAIDNVSLTRSCPPASIRVSEVEVCWPSVSNAVYHVDYRSDLTTNTWVPLFTNIVAISQETCVADRVVRGTPHRFYRVVCPTEGE